MVESDLMCWSDNRSMFWSFYSFYSLNYFYIIFFIGSLNYYVKTLVLSIQGNLLYKCVILIFVWPINLSRLLIFIQLVRFKKDSKVFINADTATVVFLVFLILHVLYLYFVFMCIKTRLALSRLESCCFVWLARKFYMCYYIISINIDKEKRKQVLYFCLCTKIVV